MLKLSMFSRIRLNFPLIITLFFVLSLVFAVRITAQSNLLLDKQEAIKAGGNQESWINEALSSNIVSTLNALVGEVPEDVITGKTTLWIPGGFVSSVNNTIAKLYSPPASGVEYIASTWNNFLGKPAYAQNGSGFTGLQALLPIWRVFRNITYLLSSLFFIVIGILIMLRVKISPQAVIDLQNAVPKVITTLILITFSYAIAGLIIDVAFFIQSAVLALLFSVDGIPFTQSLLKPDVGHALVDPNRYSFAQLSNGGMTDFVELAFLALPKLSIIVIGMLLGALIGGLLSGVPSLGLGAPLGTVGGAGIGAALFVLIITIMVLIWLLQFFFGALKCYITIIFKIITGPLEICLDAVPNSKVGFSSWVWNLIANIAVFPISFLFLILANMIIQKTAYQVIWAPNFLMDANIPMGLTNVLSLASGGIIPIAVGIGTLMLLSKLPEMIPQFIFMIKPSAWEQAIGQAMAPAGKFGTATAWQAGNEGFKWAETAGGTKAITNTINRIPGVTVSTSQVSTVAGAAKNVYQGVGANVAGQKLT